MEDPFLVCGEDCCAVDEKVHSGSLLVHGNEIYVLSQGLKLSCV